MATNDSVGIMHPAYFVGRAELLDWLNSTLQLRLTKIEETASGAVACQIFDLLFPNTVHMTKVNWGARSEWEFINNYKVLQAACDKVGVDRKIEVDRLIKARAQDNLEFLQWLKKFYDDNSSSVAVSEYDASARRALGKGASSMKWAKGSSTSSSSTPAASAISPGRTSTTRPVRTATTVSPPNPAKAAPVSSQPRAPMVTKVEKENASSEQTAVVSALKSEIEMLRKTLAKSREENEAQLMRIEHQLRACENERDFYFGKLKNVEMALQDLSKDDQQDGQTIVTTIYHVINDEPDSELKEVPGDQE